MDGILQLLSAEGFLLEENNDDHGLDRQLVFTAPKDGAYLLRVFAFPSGPDAVTAKPVQSTGAGGKSAALNIETMQGPVSGTIRIVCHVPGQRNLTRIASAPRIKLPQTTPHLWLTVRE